MAGMSDPMNTPTETCPTCDFGTLKPVKRSITMPTPSGPVFIEDLLFDECDYCGERAYDKAARQHIERVIRKP